jgi:hypothetical protein
MSHPATPEIAAEIPKPPPSVERRAALIRLYFLLAILALMLGALWYDYMVARAGVSSAYDQISTLNTTMNSARSLEVTEVSHVQETLGRQPTRIIQNGIYTIEVYEWAAGMPVKINAFQEDEPTFGLRTHDYYAVYRGQMFQRHYKFAIPPEEWDRASDQSVAQFLKMLSQAKPADDDSDLEESAKMMQKMEEMQELQAQEMEKFVTPPRSNEPDSGRPRRPPLEREVELTSGEEPAADEEEAIAELGLQDADNSEATDKVQ